jgi:hypothetical protein
MPPLDVKVRIFVKAPWVHLPLRNTDVRAFCSLESTVPFADDPWQPVEDRAVTQGFVYPFPTQESTSTLQLLRQQHTPMRTVQPYGLIHNAPPLTPIEPLLVPVQLQICNLGLPTSLRPHHTTVASHIDIPPAVGGHSHSYVPPAFEGHLHNSSASHVMFANEPSSPSTLDTFQRCGESQKAAYVSRRENLSLPWKGQSNAKHKQYSSSGKQIAKPLTLYNFFFRVERNRLVQEASSVTGETVLDPNVTLQEFYTGVLRDQSRFMEQVLLDQWTRDPSKKRKHQKVHGKISFETMSRLIAANWQALPDSVKDVFRQIAARDQRRYDQEVRNAAATS